jgi:hypothetical protein
MKLKIQLLVIISIFTSNTFSQTKFLKGYFINNSGQKTDCLIKNVDWKNNPKQFEYKINENESSKINTINEVKEFYIDDVVKYIRETLDIDTSSDNIQDYSIQREPIFKNEQVFLKVLVEGSNNLYLYEGEYAPRLFFSTKTMPVQQLIYKNYYESVENKTDLLINKDYKKQLFLNVKCSSEDLSLNNLEYNSNAMIKYFLKVNSCDGTGSKEISINKKSKLNFKPLLAVNNSSVNLNFETGNTRGNYDLERKISLGFGFELESVLPFNNYVWSIFVQPTYNSYKSEILINIPFDTFPNYNVNLTYNYFQIPLGVRRYFFVNENSKIWVDLAFNSYFVSKSSKLEIDRQSTVDLSKFKYSLCFGVGYKYKKIEFGFNYYPKLDLSNSENPKNSFNYSNTSLNLKYTLFNN